MQRYIQVADDGETILATLTMNEEDALLNLQSSNVIVELQNDSGAFIDNGALKYNSSGGGSIVTISGGTVPTEFSSLDLQELAPV